MVCAVTRLAVLGLPLMPFFLTPACGRNLLANSSFEVGSWGWNRWMDCSGARGYQGSKGVAEYLGVGDCPSGATFLRVPNKEGFLLESDFVRVSPFSDYAVSFYAKCEGGGDMTLAVAVISGFPGKDSASNSGEIAGRFDITSEWRRFSATGKLGVEGSRVNGFSVRFEGGSPAPGVICIDAVQLEQGVLTEYGPGTPVEVAGALAGWEETTHLYFTDEPVEVVIKCWNSRKDDLVLALRVFDLFGSEVLGREVPVVFGYRENVDVRVRLDVAKTGAFRLVISTMQGAGPACNSGEVIFGVVPRPAGHGRSDEKSFVGFQGNPGLGGDGFKLKQIRKVGVKWFRALDFVSPFGWHPAEPEKGTYLWPDEEARELLDAKLSVLPTQLRQPRWASSAPEDVEGWDFAVYPPRDYDEFGDFVGRAVGRYKGKIDYWEVGNEPYSSVFWRGTPEEYVKYVKTAYLAAKAANPECKIVGGVCGFRPQPRSFMERAFRAGLLDYLDILSFHDYGTRTNEDAGLGRRLDGIRALMNKYGRDLPMWNSEGGLRSRGFSAEVCGSDDLGTAHVESDLSPVGAAAGLIKTYAVTMGHGVTKYFYYFAYSHSHYGGEYPNNVEWLEGYQGPMVERNGIPKPLMVAQAVFLHLLDRARPVESFVTDLGAARRVNAHLFESDGRPVAVVWGDNILSGNYRVSLPLKSRQVKVLGLMGNEVASRQREGSTLDVSEIPVYLVGSGVSAGVVRKALSSMRVDGALSPGVARIVEALRRSGVRRELNTLDFSGLTHVGKVAVPEPAHAYLYENRRSGERRVLLWLDGTGARVSLPAGVLNEVREVDSRTSLLARFHGRAQAGGKVELSSDGQVAAFTVGERPLLLGGDFRTAGWDARLRQLTVSGLKPFVFTETRLTRDGYTVVCRNLTGSEQEFALTIVREPDWLGLTRREQRLVLPGYQSGKAVFGLRERFFRAAQPEAGERPAGTEYEQRLVVQVDTEHSGSFREEDRVDMMRAARLTGEISIDGDIGTEEWADAPRLLVDNSDASWQPHTYAVTERWSGSSDCSARVQAMWDRRSLYLAFDVTDDVLSQREKGGSLTLGDCVEVLLSKSLLEHLGEEGITEDDRKLCFAPLPEKEGACSTIAPYDIDAAWKRTGSGYSIEAAVPWGCLGDLRPEKEKVVGFDVAVDDNDGGSRKYQLVWSGTGQHYYLRSKREGALVFCE